LTKHAAVGCVNRLERLDGERHRFGGVQELCADDGIVNLHFLGGLHEAVFEEAAVETVVRLVRGRKTGVDRGGVFVTSCNDAAKIFEFSDPLDDLAIQSDVAWWFVAWEVEAIVLEHFLVLLVRPCILRFADLQWMLVGGVDPLGARRGPSSVLGGACLGGLAVLVRVVLGGERAFTVDARKLAVDVLGEVPFSEASFGSGFSDVDQ